VPEGFVNEERYVDDSLRIRIHVLSNVYVLQETIQELESKREQLMKQNEHLLEIACTTLITWQRIVQETSQQQQAISMKKRST
jgi:hypothetical protein